MRPVQRQAKPRKPGKPCKLRETQCQTQTQLGPRICRCVGRLAQASYILPRLAIAYEDESAATTTKSLARRYAVSPRTVRRVNALAAVIYLRRQQELTQALLTLFRERLRCRCSCWTLAFDSTSQLMSLPAHPVLSRSQLRSSWHVMVSLSSAYFLWSGEDRLIRSATQTFVRPVVPMMSTSAECVEDSLFLTPTIAAFTSDAERWFDQVVMKGSNTSAFKPQHSNH